MQAEEDKSSHLQMVFNIGVLKLSQHSQEKSCVGVLNNWCFPVKIVKFLRKPFSQYTSGQLLLNRLLVLANLVSAFRLRELIRYYVIRYYKRKFSL